MDVLHVWEKGRDLAQSNNKSPYIRSKMQTQKHHKKVDLG